MYALGREGEEQVTPPIPPPDVVCPGITGKVLTETRAGLSTSGVRDGVGSEIVGHPSLETERSPLSS